MRLALKFSPRSNQVANIYAFLIAACCMQENVWQLCGEAAGSAKGQLESQLQDGADSPSTPT